ncbi:MAG: DUF6172 family protein [Campylobacterota bacterium]|nr:DUF6172 family protein [Campylobacterota bacterium]
MKKVFKLQLENKKPDRVIDSIKNEIRKYLKRERKKKLPEDAVFWDFDCRFGAEQSSAKSVTANEVITSLDIARQENWEACYVEIIAKASFKA